MIRVLSFSDSISAEPYHIVMYHDMYYLIGNRPGMENLSHYRIDLMSDLKVLTDDVGNPVRRTPAAKLAGGKETVREWDPMKYMSEHLNMGYDEPRRIKIKIPKDQMRDRQVKRKIWECEKLLSDFNGRQQTDATARCMSRVCYIRLVFA